jgi:hypothetical protein
VAAVAHPAAAAVHTLEVSLQAVLTFRDLSLRTGMGRPRRRADWAPRAIAWASWPPPPRRCRYSCFKRSNPSFHLVLSLTPSKRSLLACRFSSPKFLEVSLFPLTHQDVLDRRALLAGDAANLEQRLGDRVRACDMASAAGSRCVQGDVADRRVPEEKRAALQADVAKVLDVVVHVSPFQSIQFLTC